MAPSRASRGLRAAWSIAACAAFLLALGASATGWGNLSTPPDRPDPSPLVAPVGARPLHYDRDIRPLLADRCFKCHGPDAGTRRADLRLDEAESATAAHDSGTPIVPGNPESSELLARIASADKDEVMPPPESGKRALSVEDRELLRAWIAQGAAYEPHWSFVAPKRPPAPHVRRAEWCRNDADRFILARLESESIDPSPEADRDTLARRVFLDLTGLPPTPEELDGYAAEASARTDAYERLVDRLLTQEPYRTRTAERLATPWMDAARYGDTCGIHTDDGRQMWAWRDWVLRAFRDNMPYDRFLTEQLAGDLLPSATIEQKIASGFNRNHVTTDEGGAIPEEYLVEYAVDRASTTATTFLGLTMGCARCHDHKFDPISQQEFYGFYAFFNSIEEPGLYTQTPDANRAYEPFIDVPTPEQSALLASYHKEQADLRAAQSATTPEEERQHAAFLEEFPREIGVAWLGSRVVSASSSGGATLTVQGDGSVLASGTNPDMDVHEFLIERNDSAQAERPGEGVRLILLEALKDPSMPRGGVGRAENGNAVLSGVDVELVSPEAPDTPSKLPVSWLWSDTSQPDGDYHFTNALLGTRATDHGWAVAGHQKDGNRRLLLMLRDPVRLDGSANLRVRLRYESVYPKHAFGRVRFTLGTISDASKLPLEFGNWRLVGPFPSADSDKVYDAAYGPESATTIDFAQNFGNGNQFWRYDPRLRDGATIALANGTNVTYVGRTIFAPAPRTLSLSLGSDDGFRLFLNGREVASHKIDRGLAPDQDKATIQLEAGANVLVMKIVNTAGESGYYFRVVSTDEAYPQELVSALLPASARAADSPAQILQAWKMSRDPKNRERQARIEALDKEIADLLAKVPRTMVMKELDTPRPTYLLKRGQYNSPDKQLPVQRSVPKALGTLPNDIPADRLALARWMTSPDNPLVARVAVNRLWEMLFGSGLVRTSEDFGQRGEWPTHPELLDWLAVEYRESGWDTRHMLRLVATSATYRQSSRARPELAERDPDNRLLAFFPRRRLPAEQVRDQALYVSGLLVEKLGGPSVKTYQPEGLWQEGALPASNTRLYERGKGDDLYRRSLYTYWKRAVPPPSMQAFDAPTREYCVVRRATTSTPLQALVLWNDPQFVEAARVLAQRTLAQPGDDTDRLASMFRRCTSHPPTPDELSALARALAAFRARYTSAPDDAAKLVAVGESMAPSDLDRPEVAAWTMVAESILDLYRTTTQE